MEKSKVPAITKLLVIYNDRWDLIFRPTRLWNVCVCCVRPRMPVVEIRNVISGEGALVCYWHPLLGWRSLEFSYCRRQVVICQLQAWTHCSRPGYKCCSLNVRCVESSSSAPDVLPASCMNGHIVSILRILWPKLVNVLSDQNALSRVYSLPSCSTYACAISAATDTLYFI